jgi:hypothetical protein
MKKTLIVLLALMVFMAVPLMAQEKEMAKEEMAKEEPAMKAPEPLNDDWSQWLVGEWQGWSESAEGKSKEWQKIELGLDGQFLLIQLKSEKEEMTYKGMGALTMNPETGESVGYWIDSMRGMYEGKGKRDGNKVTMEWKGNMGTYKETIEKVSDDKYVTSYTFTDADGNVMEGKSEMTRVKQTTEK